MKRFLIGLMAVAGLVASVLTVATSAASPTSGQTDPPGTVLLQNIAGFYDSQQSRTAAAVTVTVETVGGCNPGNLAPGNNGVFTLPAPARANIPNAVASTGLLNPRCSWTISAVNPGDSCAVAIIVDDDNDGDNGEIGRESDGSVTLSGLNSGRLVYGTNNERVTDIRFFVDLTGCVVPFSPAVSITVPTTAINGVSVYAGTEFTVAYSSTQTGCLANGVHAVVVGRTVAAGAERHTAALKEDTSPPSLVSQTRVERAKGTAGKYCEYTATVTPAAPENTDLGQSFAYVTQTLTTTVTPSGGNPETPTVGNPTRVVNGIISGEDLSVTSTRTSDSASVLTAKTYTVVAQYNPIQVKIKVTTVFPADEVFTTADRVDYTIAINAPCGGYLNILPSGFGSQGDSASSRVFPGTTLVYGEDLKPLTVGITDSRTYRVNAYADARGSRACSVTVTERNGPERCSPVGGSSRTVSYAAGMTELAFEFNHTCDAVSSGDADSEDGSGTPPAPPEIDFGDGGDEATDEATPVGPSAPGFTG